MQTYNNDRTSAKEAKITKTHITFLLVPLIHPFPRSVLAGMVIQCREMCGCRFLGSAAMLETAGKKSSSAAASGVAQAIGFTSLRR